MTVNVTVGGTATSAADYTSIGTSVTIPAGAASVPVTVTPANDTSPEADETVVVTLAGDPAYTLGATSSATVTITDNDAPANDSFANATAMSGALPLTVAGLSVRATAEGGEPAHGGSAAAASVWWVWTPAVSQIVLISTSGSDYDTRLYNTQERAEASFAASYLGGNKEDYDVIKVEGGPYAIYATDGNLDAWTRLWKAAQAGLARNAAYYRVQGRNPDRTRNLAYENLLDVDNLVDYMLVIYFGGNLDSPISAFLGNTSPNNFYGLRSRIGTEGFKFTTHDAEHTLLDINESRIGPYSAGSVLNKSNPQWVFQHCQANAEFRQRVADRIQKHFFNGGALTPAACTARFMARKNEIDRAVVGESARWGDAKSNPPKTRNVDWINEVNRIVNNYFNATPKTRTRIVLEQLTAAGLFPDLGAPQFSQLGGAIAPGFSLTISNPNAAGRIYYTRNGSDPRAVCGTIQPGTLDGGTLSAAVTLNATTTVKARILNGSTWSALLEATFYSAQDFTGLKVTEIMYNPPDWGALLGNDLEFVELKNTGATTLDLSGVQFSGGISFVFPNGTSMALGEFIILASNSVQFQAKYPGVTPFGQYAGHLANGGETLILTFAGGATILSLNYDDDPPWAAAADGLGFSLVPVNPNLNPDPDDAANWRASTNAGGSPGADDPASAIAPILVNEALTHTDLPLVDAIELYNPGASAANIGGWYLADDRALPKKYRIPDGTVIGAGQYRAFDENQFNNLPGGPTSFSLDAKGETVYVFAADLAGNLTGYSHGFEFGAAATGIPFGRYTISTGEDQFPAMVNRTLGAQNSGPLVRPVVISEIMYNPAAGGDQFVEIVNLTAASVPLYDPANPANTWKINGLGYAFPANTQLPAYGILVVCGSSIDPAAFRTKYSVPRLHRCAARSRASCSSAARRWNCSGPTSPAWTRMVIPSCRTSPWMPCATTGRRRGRWNRTATGRRSPGLTPKSTATIRSTRMPVRSTAARLARPSRSSPRGRRISRPLPSPATTSTSCGPMLRRTKAAPE